MTAPYKCPVIYAQTYSPHGSRASGGARSVCPSGIGKGSQGYAGRKALEHNGNMTQNP